MTAVAESPLTERQAEVLGVIVSHIEVYGYPPTVREIGEAVGMTSPATVQQHLIRLVELGCIEREAHTARAIRVLRDHL